MKLHAKLLLALLLLSGGITIVVLLALTFQGLPDVASISGQLAPPSIRITDRNARLLYEILNSRPDRSHTRFG
jgi:hypothetical protein